MRRILTTTILLALASCAYASGDGQLDRATLKGLQAVSVIIDPIDPELQKLGITAESLRKQVEDALTRNGIAVDRNAVDFLGLRATSAQAKRTSVALCLTLGLYQAVILARDATVRTATDTWGTHSIALAPPKTVPQAAADITSELVDRFAEAYKSVNPR